MERAEWCGGTQGGAAPAGKPIETAPRAAVAAARRRLHILQWLPGYTRADAVSDLIAGLTVGLTMIPQSIAYASLAGLPAQFGLYTAFVGSFAYIFFGTVKEVSIGPTTLMALLTISYTEGLGLDHVVLLTLVSGCVELLMGLLQLGFIAEFISPAVNSGFTSSMAVVLTLSQLKNLLGLRSLHNRGLVDVLAQLAHRRREVRAPDALLAAACVGALLALKHLPRLGAKARPLSRALWLISISRNIIVLAAASAVACYMHERRGGSPFRLAGAVPQGLPGVALPRFSTTGADNTTVSFAEMLHALGSGVLVVPICAVLANAAIAKFYANGIVDSTQEMVALGLCNIFGALFQAMPSCGAFTRSAVASSGNVRTPLQGLYSGVVIVLALSFLTPYFFYIPRATLGAILVSAVMTLFDYKIFPKLWRINKFDFWLTLATFLLGIFFSLEMGLIFSGLFNMIILLKVWTRPKIVTEIRLDEKGVDYVYICPELGLYYPAIDYFSQVVTNCHTVASNLSIVIDCANIVKIDYSSSMMIVNMVNKYRDKCVKLNLVNLRPSIFKKLQGEIDLGIMSVYQTNDKHCGGDVPLLIQNEIEQQKFSYCDNV